MLNFTFGKNFFWRHVLVWPSDDKNFILRKFSVTQPLTPKFENSNFQLFSIVFEDLESSASKTLWSMSILFELFNIWPKFISKSSKIWGIHNSKTIHSIFLKFGMNEGRERSFRSPLWYTYLVNSNFNQKWNMKKIMPEYAKMKISLLFS